MEKKSELNQSVELSSREANLRNETNINMIYTILKAKGRTDAAEKAEAILAYLEPVLNKMIDGIDEPESFKKEVFKSVSKEFGREAAKIAKRIFNARLHAVVKEQQAIKRNAVVSEKTARDRLKLLADHIATKLDVADSIYISPTEKINISGMKVAYKNHSSSFNRTGVCMGFVFDTLQETIMVEVVDASYRAMRPYTCVKFMVENERLHNALSGYLSYLKLYKDSYAADIEAETAAARAAVLKQRLLTDNKLNDFSFERQRWFLFKDRERFVTYMKSFAAEFKLLTEALYKK